MFQRLEAGRGEVRGEPFSILRELLGPEEGMHMPSDGVRSVGCLTWHSWTSTNLSPQTWPLRLCEDAVSRGMAWHLGPHLLKVVFMCLLWGT